MLGKSQSTHAEFVKSLLIAMVLVLATGCSSWRPKAPDDPSIGPYYQGTINEVCTRVAAKTGVPCQWQWQPVPSLNGAVAMVQGSRQSMGPVITAMAASMLMEHHELSSRTKNAWAFIIGHELAHIYLGHQWGSPQNESEADILGAKFAKAAGFNVEGYVGYLLSGPNACSPSHGCWHRRAYKIAQAMGMDTSGMTTAMETTSLDFLRMSATEAAAWAGSTPDGNVAIGIDRVVALNER